MTQTERHPLAYTIGPGLYHGTDSISLQQIVSEGLVPQIFHKERGLILGPIHALRPDRITWVTEQIRYAQGAAAGRSAHIDGAEPVVLQITGTIIGVDVCDEGIGGDFGQKIWTEEIITPDRLCVLTDGRWVPIA